MFVPVLQCLALRAMIKHVLLDCQLPAASVLTVIRTAHACDCSMCSKCLLFVPDFTSDTSNNTTLATAPSLQREGPGSVRFDCMMLFNECWYVSQASGSGAPAKQPEGNKGNREPQYFGTVVDDPGVSSNLPVLEW